MKMSQISAPNRGITIKRCLIPFRSCDPWPTKCGIPSDFRPRFLRNASTEIEIKFTVLKLIRIHCSDGTYCLWVFRFACRNASQRKVDHYHVAPIETKQKNASWLMISIGRLSSTVTYHFDHVWIVFVLFRRLIGFASAIDFTETANANRWPNFPLLFRQIGKNHSDWNSFGHLVSIYFAFLAHFGSGWCFLRNCFRHNLASPFLPFDTIRRIFFLIPSNSTDKCTNFSWSNDRNNNTNW